jgi:hypothetical protein
VLIVLSPSPTFSRFDIITDGICVRIGKNRARVELDPDDPDGQSLLLWCPTAMAEGNAYIRRAIKIESGAKSALDPHVPVVVRPYVADDLPNLDLAVGNVTTVDPSRTFWDKVIILHGLRRWWDRRGELKGGGQRVQKLLRITGVFSQSEPGVFAPSLLGPQ